MNTWHPIPETLPPLEIPVWLYLPSINQPIIGCRTEDEGEWYWARCYDDYWFDQNRWWTSTSEMDDITPSHWQPLPQPPTPPTP